MSVCDPVCSPGAVNDADFSALTGLELQHDLYLTIPTWAAWSAVSDHLVNAGAEVQSVQISRQNDGFSARCRLKQITPEAVRGLSGRFLDTGLARRASVEHLVLPRVAGGRL